MTDGTLDAAASMTTVSRPEAPFDRWAQAEGIPVVRGRAVEDLLAVPVEPWGREGCLGALIILEGGQGWNSACVCEIPAGTTTRSHRHLHQEQICILQGQGETDVWTREGERTTVSWGQYGVMGIPLNVWHRHRCNGPHPARFISVIDLPSVLNLFRDSQLIFDTDYAFPDRFQAPSSYFDPSGSWQGRVWTVNFIPNAMALKLGQASMGTGMGTGMGIVLLNLAENALGTHSAHISEQEAGTYKKAHRHVGGAHIIWLSGAGYTLLWEGQGQRIRVDWKAGSLISPPEGWYHQHFNLGPEPARHLAILRGSYGVGRVYRAALDVRKGGDQIEYEDEAPEIRRLFEEELKRLHLECRMPAAPPPK